MCSCSRVKGKLRVKCLCRGTFESGVARPWKGEEPLSHVKGRVECVLKGISEGEMLRSYVPVSDSPKCE